MKTTVSYKRITILLFAITRVVPGGPLERAIMEAQQASMDSGLSSTAGQDMALSEEQLQQLKEYYGFDKPVLVSYGLWVGKLLQGDLGMSYRYNEPVWVYSYEELGWTQEVFSIPSKSINVNTDVVIFDCFALWENATADIGYAYDDLEFWGADTDHDSYIGPDDPDDNDNTVP